MAARAAGGSLNPALPVLLLLATLPLLLGRRRRGAAAWTQAWLASALAATCGLGAALARPAGIPSNAGLLAAHAPWQQSVAPGGDPHLLDEIHQIEPWLLHLRRELRDGRLPLWNPHQHSGEPYWSNGQTAPLFPLHLLFVAFPERAGLLILPWLRLAVGGLGAWALARRLGVRPRAALLAAVGWPLCGPVTAFLLFPMANTHALVPWVMWAVERLASGRGTWLALAITAGLQLLGGHPETPVLTALLAAVYLVARRPRRPLHAWLGFAGGWLAAGAVSAVHNLPLAATLFGSSKWLELQPPSAVAWPLKLRLMLRLVVPFPWGTGAEGTWWGPFNEPATRLYAGAVVVALAVAALPLIPRDPRWRGVAAMGLAALAGAYHLPLAREALLALPLVRHALHHYLKIGVSLALVLLAAAGWGALLSGRARRPALAGVGIVATLLAVALWLFLPGWRERGELASQAAEASARLLAAIAVAGAAALAAGPRRRLALAAPALLLLDLGVAHAPRLPVASIGDVYPVTPLVERLRASPGRFAGVGTALRPDAAMVYGLFDVRGDTPVKLARYQRMYGSLAEHDPVYFRPIRRWRDPWLDHLGVRWVVAAPGEASPVPGWTLAYDGADGRLWERPSAAPLVRWEHGGAAAPEVLLREPGHWRLRWRTPRAARLLIAETWDAGWRAETERGGEVPIRAWRGVLMAVDLPAGQGELEIAYLPRGLPEGAALSGVAALVLGLSTWRRWRGRRLGTPRHGTDRPGQRSRAARPPA